MNTNQNDKMYRNYKTGIVILNYNSHDLTFALANKTAGFYTVDYICVVDNCSNDDFDGEFTNPIIHYVKNGRNTGYNSGNNVGLRYLVEDKGCKYVFIANPDVIFDNQAIEKMCDVLEDEEDIALISTKRFGPDFALLHQYFDFPSFRTSLKCCFFLPRHKFTKNRWAIQNKRINSSTGIEYVDAVPGAFFGIRSEFLKRNNFLYEGIFLYGEEIITGRQAFNLGYKSAIINTAVYIHNHHQAHFNNRRMFWLDRQSLLKYYKMFNLLGKVHTPILKCAIQMGTLEYNIMFAIGKLLHK